MNGIHSAYQYSTPAKINDANLPSQAVSTKPVSRVLFGKDSFKPSSEFPQEHQDKMWKMMQKYKYRKPLDALVCDSSPFHTQFKDDKVHLKGYEYHPQLPGKDIVEGVCHELGQKFLQELEQEFGSQYDFILLNGHSPEYFFAEDSNHVFIIACPKGRDILKELETIESLDVLNSIKELPKGCLLLDPSFKNLENTNKSTGYTFSQMISGRDTGSNQDAVFYLNVPIGNVVYTTDFKPLGYFSDYNDLPEQFIAYKPSDILLGLCFRQKMGEKPTPWLAIQNKPDADAVIFNMTEDFVYAQPPSNKLRQFFEKIVKQLGVSGSELGKAELDLPTSA